MWRSGNRAPLGATHRQPQGTGSWTRSQKSDGGVAEGRAGSGGSALTDGERSSPTAHRGVFNDESKESVHRLGRHSDGSATVLCG